MIQTSLHVWQDVWFEKIWWKKKKKRSCLQPLKKTISCRSDNIHYEFWILEQKWQHFTRVRTAHLWSGSRHGYSRQSCERRRGRLRVSSCERLTESARHQLGGLGVIKAEPQVSGKGIMALMQMASRWLWYDCRVCVVKRFPQKRPCLFKQRELMRCPSWNGAPGSW